MTLSLSTKLSGIFGGGAFGYTFASDPTIVDSPAGTRPYYVAHVVLDQAQAIINPATDDTLQAIAATLKGTLSVSFASDPSALAQDASVQAVKTALGTPAQDATVAAVTARLAAGIPAAISNWPATQQVSLAAAPLPPGAATDASLLAIKAAIQAQLDLATSVWTDGTNFYVRREVLNEGTGAITVAFTNPDGSAATVSAAGLKPVASDNALTLQQAQFDVTQAGTGTAVGDVLARVVVVNKAVTPPTASAALWLNLTQGTTLTTPPVPAAIVEQTQHLAVTSMPANVAQDASVQAITIKLGTTLSFTDAVAVAALGTPADAAAANGGSGSLIAIGKGILAKLFAGIGVTGTFYQATQPVSIAAGSDAATGNLTDVATASGANTSVIGALRAIRDKLLGSLAVTGTFWQATQPVSGTFWQTTQPVSSTDGALATIGTTTDAATATGTNTSVVGALRAIRDKLLGSIAVTGTFWQATQPVSGTFFQATQPTSIADGGSVTLGTKADAAATAASTSGSAIAWLRGILIAMNAATPAGTNTIGTVGPTPRVPVSGSTTTVAASSTQLWPPNAARAAWTIAAPLPVDVWINPLGGTASVGGVDCFRIPAGGYARSTAGACETSAFTYYCATGGLPLAAYQL